MENQEEIQKLQQQVQQLEQLVKQHLSKEAITRYNTIRTAHPEFAIHILTLLAQLIQSQQIQEKITDEQFKKLIKQIQPQKKEFKFKRK